MLVSKECITKLVLTAEGKQYITDHALTDLGGSCEEMPTMIMTVAETQI